MKKKYKTSLPTATLPIHRLVAKFVHISMYIVLSGMALSGLGIGFLFWVGYESGFLIEFTIWFHEFFFTLIVWLISVHIIGALYHSIQHDFVWSSMVPFFKEKS